VLTIQILTKDNFSTIGRCLDSLQGIEARIVIADMGSTDGTSGLCSERGVEVSRVDPKGSVSDVRNALLGSGSNMYIEPWERLVRGSDSLASMSGTNAFYVVQGGVVSKQVRFWEAGRFRNPVFESVDSDINPQVRPDVVIVSEGQPDSRSSNTRICREWAESSPASEVPYYYLACSLLAEGKMEEFRNASGMYLAMERERGDSYVLMNYYMAVADANRGDLKTASRRAAMCVASKPTFAEFWCLLGDMFYARGAYEKALHMYENARVMGRRRSSYDLMPVELPKYEDYPSKMEASCRKRMGENLIVASKR